MMPGAGTFSFLGLAAVPFIYYLIVLFSSWRFFRRPRAPYGATPPVSILKPIRGLDPGAYENFASLCRQDYLEYELLFCAGKEDDRALAVIEKLVRDYPERSIRVLVGS